MDTTIYLAQIWGPVMLAVGIGMFVSRNYYIKLYRDIDKAPFAALIFGMAAMATGIAQVAAHNVWDTGPQIIISLLGWGLLLKGALFTAWPDFVDLMGDWAVYSKLIPIAGAAVLVLGAYVTWIGYFA